ncbi:nucleotidyltransferase domain-containing protein [Spirulina sp. CCNP1310]|uniref:nucleotidyltransferase family protein n=1 Tax=Spirulina sp. CCNP1310 TaxID=3110249 RepID=UPI002B20FCDE|nr:nucleotidyltransferase domain-containing protein [Spirulina sp. CCNP1310]MEA5420794.1 nucleotidyltransferase domain-containing protein [Spirulina sp. CCNP1310]
MALPLATQQDIIQRVRQARSQRAKFLAAMGERQVQGWAIARQAAQQLKTEFGAHRVVLFGSWLNVEQMHWYSDLDLAVSGLPRASLYRAGAKIERGHDFMIDLIEAEWAKPHIQRAIALGIAL